MVKAIFNKSDIGMIVQHQRLIRTRYNLITFQLNVSFNNLNKCVSCNLETIFKLSFINKTNNKT